MRREVKPVGIWATDTEGGSEKKREKGGGRHTHPSSIFFAREFGVSHPARYAGFRTVPVFYFVFPWGDGTLLFSDGHLVTQFFLSFLFFPFFCLFFWC